MIIKIQQKLGDKKNKKIFSINSNADETIITIGKNSYEVDKDGKLNLLIEDLPTNIIPFKKASDTYKEIINIPKNYKEIIKKAFEVVPFEERHTFINLLSSHLLNGTLQNYFHEGEEAKYIKEVREYVYTLRDEIKINKKEEDITTEDSRPKILPEYLRDKKEPKKGLWRFLDSC